MCTGIERNLDDFDIRASTEYAACYLSSFFLRRYVRIDIPRADVSLTLCEVKIFQGKVYFRIVFVTETLSKSVCAIYSSICSLKCFLSYSAKTACE